MEYLVKWKGFDFSENSWVKKADMHCRELLKEFKKGKVYEDEECKFFSMNIHMMEELIIFSFRCSAPGQKNNQEYDSKKSGKKCLSMKN